MTNGKSLAQWCRAQIGRSYDDVDCMGLIVEGVRTLGTTREEEQYRCAGCNELWRSLNASGKYRYITARTPIKEAKAKGMIVPGAILAIHEEGYNAKYDDWEGDCSHVAIYVGDDDYEVIHSSATRGQVCGTKVSSGFTHMLEHRMISLADTAEAESDEQIEEIEMIVVTQKDPLNIRKEPTAKSECVGQAAQGKTVIVTGAVEMDEKGRAWAPVRYKPENRRTEVKGYACMDYLAIDGSKETAIEEAAVDDRQEETGDLVSMPREVLLTLADAVNEAEMTSEGATTWRECLEGIDRLIRAAKNAAAYLKGDD